ncbi:MAG: ABC transporter permease, partial [Candidatus Hydrogenedentes bacterium]|nr:ABC transporter permease [Candidatus Hydrogenedentota bacterium]
PSILMSGFMFPIESMPRLLSALSLVIPATYWIQILRGVILRAAGFSDLWDQGLWMIVIGIFVLIIAASRFRKTLA